MVLEFCQYLSGPSGASTVQAGNDRRQLEELLDSKQLVPQLIAASWSLSGGQRTEAIKRLKALASDINPEISALAEAQLWKTRVKTTAEGLESWKNRIRAMPESVRAGPYFILAGGLAGNNQIDEAALAYLRIPILHPEQHSLVAASLYQCGDLLQNKGRSVQARTLWRELIQKYPQSFWAQQAASKLSAAAPRK